MRTKTKKTKQITQIVVSMLLVLTMVFMPMKMILAADAQSSSTPTQFVLVLDCSGSMEESDVNGLSPKAAKMFVDMMPVENAQIAVVAFGANWGEDSYVYPGDTTSNTYTKVILGMTDVGTEKAKKKVKEAIDETAKVRDKNGYGKNPAKLYVVKGDEESAQTFDMTVDEENQCYTGKVILNQTGMVKVKAVVESGHFRNDRKETGYITFNVKNRPVTKVKDLEDLNMGFGEEQTIDLNTYFNDPDQDKFICNFEVDQTAGIEVTLDEQNVMHIKTGTKAGNVQVKVGVNDGSMDQDVTSSFTIHMVNQPLREKGSKKISKTITYNANKVPGFLKKKLGPDGSSNAEIKLDDYFEDPDGAAPIYAIEKLPESSKIQIKESAPGVLSITATGEGKETFHVSATDANDGSIRFEKEISVKSISAGSWVWKQIRVPIIASVIILVIAIVFLILMFAGRKIYGVWEITVGGRLEGPYPLGKMAHGKKAKCSLSGAIEDFGFSSINDGGITLKAGNNFNKSVTITGLEKAATVTYAGREYDTAAGKTLKKTL